jgi:hypothetical protein
LFTSNLVVLSTSIAVTRTDVQSRVNPVAVGPGRKAGIRVRADRVGVQGVLYQVGCAPGQLCDVVDGQPDVLVGLLQKRAGNALPDDAVLCI